jgi:hypothetical protein
MTAAFEREDSDLVLQPCQVATGRGAGCVAQALGTLSNIATLNAAASPSLQSLRVTNLNLTL